MKNLARILDRLTIISLMNIDIRELSQEINANLDYLMLVYPSVDNLLEQIEFLLENDADKDVLEKWFKLSKYSIEIVNEHLEKLRS